MESTSCGASTETPLVLQRLPSELHNLQPIAQTPCARRQPLTVDHPVRAFFAFYGRPGVLPPSQSQLYRESAALTTVSPDPVSVYYLDLDAGRHDLSTWRRERVLWLGYMPKAILTSQHISMGELRPWHYDPNDPHTWKLPAGLARLFIPIDDAGTRLIRQKRVGVHVSGDDGTVDMCVAATLHADRPSGASVVLRSSAVLPRVHRVQYALLVDGRLVEARTSSILQAATLPTASPSRFPLGAYQKDQSGTWPPIKRRLYLHALFATLREYGMHILVAEELYDQRSISELLDVAALYECKVVLTRGAMTAGIEVEHPALFAHKLGDEPNEREVARLESLYRRVASTQKGRPGHRVTTIVGEALHPNAELVPQLWASSPAHSFVPSSASERAPEERLQVPALDGGEGSIRWVRYYPFKGQAVRCVPRSADIPVEACPPKDDAPCAPSCQQTDQYCDKKDCYTWWRRFDMINYNKEVSQSSPIAAFEIAENAHHVFSGRDVETPEGGRAVRVVPERDWWLVAQAFGKPVRGHWLFPTEAELRGLLHLGLAHGTRGLIAYSLQDPRRFVGLLDIQLRPRRGRDGSEPIRAMQRIASFVREHETLLLTHVPGDFNVSVDGYGLHAVPRKDPRTKRRYLYVVCMDTAQACQGRVQLDRSVCASTVRDLMTGRPVSSALVADRRSFMLSINNGDALLLDLNGP